MTKTSNSASYSERVFPGLSFFLATLFAPAALYLIVLAFDDFWALITFVVSELAIIFLGLFAAPKLSLSSKTLSIGNVKIPTQYVKAITVVEASAQQSEKGPKLSPSAYFRFQVGVKGLLKVELNDPNDPTPYWLISSRNPELVAKKFVDLTS
jgi:hypothetical protein